MKNPYIKRLRKQFVLVTMGICLGFLLVIFGVQYISSRRSMLEDSRAALDMALNRNGRFMIIPDLQDMPPEEGGPGDSGNPGDGFKHGNEEKRGDGFAPGDEENPADGFVPGDEENPADGFAPGDEENPADGFVPGNDRFDRTAILVVRVNADGSIEKERNELFYLEETDVTTLVNDAIDTGKTTGILKKHKMRFLMQAEGDEKRIAFVDISSELSKLSKDLRRSLLISAGVLVAMFLLSLWLSGIALRPVAKAWDDQKRFVADASHELKTPLTVILSNAEMMRKSKDKQTPKNARRLDNVETEAVRMKELVQELLEVARGDMGAKELSLEDTDLSELVNDCSMVWEPMIFEAGKTLVTEIDDNIHIRGNADSLRRLTDILLDNALKYSSAKGTITLRLSSGLSTGVSTGTVLSDNASDKVSSGTVLSGSSSDKVSSGSLPGGNPAKSGVSSGTVPSDNSAKSGVSSGTVPSDNPAKSGPLPGGNPAKSGVSSGTVPSDNSAKSGSLPGGNPAKSGVSSGTVSGGNSVKSGSLPGGSPTAKEVSSHTVLRKKKNKKGVILTVENDGTPMPPDALEKVFDRFYRADASREETCGYGLGLSIAQTIVKQHGGSISATATDHSNIFTVTL